MDAAIPRRQVQGSVMFGRWRMQVIERNESLTVRPTKWFVGRRGATALSLWVVLSATPAMSQQSAGTVTETVTMRRDVNGRDAVSEKVVTHRARTNDDERVVVETYLPSIEAGRLMLSQRVTRVTRVMSYGTETVEETEERNPAAPSEPLRVVQRSVTTLRRSGTDSYVSERQVFEADGNGRLVLVRKH